MADIHNLQRVPDQEVYDSFNNLVFLDDTRVFFKMTKKIELYNKIKDLNGDMVEVGVFKGAGIALLLKLKKMYEPNSLTKVIGFDFFNKNEVLDTLTGLNKDLMTQVLTRADNEDLSLAATRERLSAYSPSDYMLIQGDAVLKAEEFNKNNPGARIKLLILDIDVGNPTYEVLKTLWNKVVKNGIVIFDEYGFHRWDESDGVDRFLKEIKNEYEFFDTKIIAPSAYIRKL
jgi:hypothetical protein